MLKDPQNATLLASIVSFLKGLNRTDISSAVAEIDAKQALIVGTGDVSDLDLPNLLLYTTLGRARVVLTATDLSGAMAADVGTWFVEHAIPILEELAQLALPLLLMA